MRRIAVVFALFALFALFACGDTSDGARSQCAVGGAIQGTCPLEDRTVEGACWRLVDCGVMLLQSQNDFDWARCVNRIDGVTPAAQQLIIDCIAGSTCDALKVGGSPAPDPGTIHCLQLGGTGP
jgi:hypothetical protein